MEVFTVLGIMTFTYMACYVTSTNVYRAYLWYKE